MRNILLFVTAIFLLSSISASAQVERPYRGHFYEGVQLLQWVKLTPTESATNVMLGWRCRGEADAVGHGCREQLVLAIIEGDAFLYAWDVYGPNIVYTDQTWSYNDRGGVTRTIPVVIITSNVAQYRGKY
jgi:hypothetical protein